ncbi:bifunctional 3-(3-hydroxy-phenyl)propionate/3-hydroxycinnamic acid hydroxylase [Gordonia sp. (in: high G+C Gram-positive bacteria)]|uniref:bifunctional 3-(3-hydroxy-phenyl)propionate/3-hydroxycinnamic acid hydroxylase MhpA n=1 Tax=Gordonia sp. (in: high G+C Gram-positive bacteria) TaxID=84139 RepID=UPI0019B8A729|nr:bifunctional 3-(3-hydroxy-phenyl)propionate/3-hydroxycinnamic acid hydroxylase [Gordonia sp. (in: high G+C Gram-positive bacteria)]MBD0023116.1 bifunctional 3-(3-hydroxy-phenyl)propionate/3-hydroxycinnamic acid hydroxylase [Gordonia sp. (in: high G+C Gram-positive bacteria)]
MPESTVDTTVLIVGAGPTGLTAAALLADLGIASTIVERWPGIYPQPRAVHLDDEVLRILGHIGVADAFAEISRAGHGLRLVDAQLRTLGEYRRDQPVGRHGFRSASMYDQPDLEAVLRAAVAERDLVTLVPDTEVLDVLIEGDRVRVLTAGRVSGERRVLRARYVIGCDGANSIVRSKIGSRWQDLGFTQRWLVVDIDTPRDLHAWDGVYQICDPDRAGTFMRIGDTRYRWEFRLHDSETADHYQDLTTLAPLLGPWLGDDHTDVRLVRSTEYTFRARVADRWHDRRILLAGDAAHLTPPFIGQGLGSGLRDAHNLAWKLAAVLNGTLGPDALASYQAERKPHTVGLIRLAMTVGVIMTSGGRTGNTLRRVIVPRTQYVPSLAAKAVDSTTAPLPPSAFVRPRSAAALPATLRPAVAHLSSRQLAGTLCPNALVDGESRFDDIVGPRFALVTLDLPRSDQRTELSRRGTDVIELEPGSSLGQWLSDAGQRAAVVRPDRYVMVSGKSVAAVYTYAPQTAVNSNTAYAGCGPPTPRVPRRQIPDAG